MVVIFCLSVLSHLCEALGFAYEGMLSFYLDAAEKDLSFSSRHHLLMA